MENQRVINIERDTHVDYAAGKLKLNKLSGLFLPVI